MIAGPTCVPTLQLVQLTYTICWDQRLGFHLGVQISTSYQLYMSGGSSRDVDGQLSVPTTPPAGIIWSLLHPPSHKTYYIF
ncbi:hypothetical protein L2E82_32229 [Cichorium intybus]|uniref:Uncharacterized protein n=1 Tax=Cichorium intybus TaxID=13427 RepID=A0ACB9BGZ5_CICIN|nr:hypothetical protein L2E82_32229 [Cichorium intybus]